MVRWLIEQLPASATASGEGKYSQAMMDGDRWEAMDRRNDRQPASWRKARPSLAAVICACCFLGLAFQARPCSPRLSLLKQTRPPAMSMRKEFLQIRCCIARRVRRSFATRHFTPKCSAAMRHYRIFLPSNYDAVSTRYPVIYYLHGHSDRYTLEDYDHGEDTVPKICRFVATHAVIVVAVDGYIAREYTGFYGGDPYDVRPSGGDIDFGKYFLEQVATIDANYRTLTSRRYRATSGLSMGGFMSLYLSARYPQIIGSCSAFNPGPEFYVGEKGRRSLWRPKDYVLSYQHTPVRLVRASGDYISQYTEETRAAFASTPSVNFEFRQDEYDRHWATSIAETFDFHMRAFADPALDIDADAVELCQRLRSLRRVGLSRAGRHRQPRDDLSKRRQQIRSADHNASMGSGWSPGCVYTIESDDGRPLSDWRNLQGLRSEPQGRSSDDERSRRRSAGKAASRDGLQRP